jgi:hypothetical protein
LKSIGVTFFAFILLGFLIAPAIILLLEDNQEIAIFIDINDEEEEEEETSENLDSKTKVLENNNTFSKIFISEKNKINFSFDTYTSQQKIKVHTPPPELFL